MTSRLKLILTILALIILILTSYWYYKTKDLEPLIGIVSSISGLLTLFFLKTDNNQGAPMPHQNQKSGDNSTNYQAGRDINIK